MRQNIRPSTLNNLFKPIGVLAGIGPKMAPIFAKLIGGEYVKDAVLHLPYQIIDRRRVEKIINAPIGETCSYEVTIDAHFNAEGNRPYRVRVSDETGFMNLIFFNPNPKFLSSKLPIGATRIITGEVQERFHEKQLTHPSRMLAPDDKEIDIEFEPIYHAAAGITQKIISKACQNALLAIETNEWLDDALLKREKWPSFKTALMAVHTPSEIDALSPVSNNIKRLAYDELLARQLLLGIAGRERINSRGEAIAFDNSLIPQLLSAFGFEPTVAQTKAFADIDEDIAKPKPMMRLLQGDVGAGKTLVAAYAAVRANEGGLQAAIMAPTEILTQQHYKNLAPLMEKIGIKLEILTGKDKGKAREAKLEALKNGEINIICGTHALFQDKVEFHNLGMVVIDEQHRFGVNARRKLIAKGKTPHVLSMSATPIPRTLSMAMYGDMDVSILDEKPKGRIKIETRAMPLEKIDEIIAAIKRAIKNDDRVYWVCPLIEETETSDMAAAIARFEDLQKYFGNKVALVHGRLKNEEKQAEMARFSSGDAKILVATTVIEVGVDVKEASIIIIEHAEKFGLAQLHQLRGRVGRGTKPSFAILLYQNPLGETAKERIKILKSTDDGFVIAEEDFKLRGGGDVLGLKQSGLPKFKIADLNIHSDLLAIARQDARLLMQTDPEFETPRGNAIRELLYIFDNSLGEGD